MFILMSPSQCYTNASFRSLRNNSGCTTAPDVIPTLVPHVGTISQSRYVDEMWESCYLIDQLESNLILMPTG